MFFVFFLCSKSFGGDVVVFANPEGGLFLSNHISLSIYFAKENKKFVSYRPLKLVGHKKMGDFFYVGRSYLKCFNVFFNNFFKGDRVKLAEIENEVVCSKYRYHMAFTYVPEKEEFFLKIITGVFCFFVSCSVDPVLPEGVTLEYTSEVGRYFVFVDFERYSLGSLIYFEHDPIFSFNEITNVSSTVDFFSKIIMGCYFDRFGDNQELVSRVLCFERDFFPGGIRFVLDHFSADDGRAEEASQKAPVISNEQFRELLSERGFREIEARADGRCFYHSLAIAANINRDIRLMLRESLSIEEGSNIDGNSLYRAIKNIVQKNIKQLGMGSLSDAQRRGLNVFYCDSGSVDSWVNEDSIRHFIAPVLGIDFVLMSRDFRTTSNQLRGYYISGEIEKTLEQDDLFGHINSNTVFLFNVNSNHWNLLIPPDANRMDEIEADFFSAHGESARLLSTHSESSSDNTGAIELCDLNCAGASSSR